ncbi:hypothetical protein ACFLW1_00935 [Chloroflexota bacterium]
MADIKVGDRVRVKARKDWPTPPGYGMANAEGVVVNWVLYDEVMEDFKDFLYVNLDKAEGAGKVYLGNNMFFRAENLEKI